MIRAATQEECYEIAKKIGYDPGKGCKGVVGKGCCALYDHWTPNSANVHIWSENPRSLLSYNFVTAIFEYPFNQIGIEVLIAITPSDNEASLAFSRAVGFRDIYRIADGWSPGVDLLMREMRKKDCKWLLRVAA